MRGSFCNMALYAILESPITGSKGCIPACGDDELYGFVGGHIFPPSFSFTFLLYAVFQGVSKTRPILRRAFDDA